MSNVIGTDQDYLGTSRIKNLPDAIDAGEPVPLSQLEGLVGDYEEVRGEVVFIKNAAESAQAGAEAARDSAVSAAPLYVDTTEGLASGDPVFAIKNEVEHELAFYKNDNGAATLLYRLKLAEWINKFLTYGFERSGFTYAVPDLFKNLAIGVREDGSFTIGNIEDVGAKLSTLLSLIASEPGFERSGYILGLRDSNGLVGFGVTDTLDIMYRGQLLSEILPDPGALTAINDQLNIIGDQLELTTNAPIIVIGDSTVQGTGSSGGFTLPAQLATLSGRSVVNKGLGGQDSNQIIARIGAICALLTMDGNEIPASGSVTATANVSILFNAGGSGSITGEIAGVSGTLSWTSGGGYTFTRTSDGDLVNVPPASPFIPDSLELYKNHVLVVGMSTNDLNGTLTLEQITAKTDQAYENHVRVYEAISQLNPHVIFIGAYPPDNADSYIGTNKYNARRNLAARLSARFPKNYIDIDYIFRFNGDGSAEDNADIANGITPRSLRSDNLHPNNSGYAITANTVNARLTQNGW